MTPKKKPTRPKSVTVDTVKIRASRGPRPDGSWYWRADRGGRRNRVHVWCGWATPETVGQKVMAHLLSKGERPKRNDVQVRTIHDLLATWTEAQKTRKDISEFTRRNSESAANRLSGLIGHALVERADLRTVEEYRDRSPDAGATIARDLKYLRQAWRWGYNVGAVSKPELPKVKVVRQAPVRSRFTPNREQVAHLIAEVRKRSEAAYRGVVLLAATGARPAGVAALLWRDVAKDFRSVHLTDKTGPRDIELHPDVTAELIRWGRKDDTCPVVGVTDKHIRWHLRQAGEKLGMPDNATPTGLRRYVVDLMYQPGGDIGAAAKQLGHSAVTALGIYRQVSSKDQRAAVLRAGVGLPQVEEDNVIPMERK